MLWLLACCAVAILRPAAGACCVYKTTKTGVFACLDDTEIMCPGLLQEDSTCNRLNGEATADSISQAAAGLCQPAELQGDTLFEGFDNSTIDFAGRAGHTYTLLADPSLTVNMQLVEAGPSFRGGQPKGKGNFVGGMAVLLPGFELLARVDQPGNMTFEVNGVSKTIERAHVWPNAQIRYEPYVPGQGQVFFVEHPPLQLRLAAVKEFNDPTSGYNRGHFELMVQLTAAPTKRLAGVIGETLYDKYEPFTSQDEARFEVPSLASAARSTWAARRLLAAKSSSYPAFASMGIRQR